MEHTVLLTDQNGKTVQMTIVNNQLKTLSLLKKKKRTGLGCKIVAKCGEEEITYNSMRICSKALGISLSLISNIVNQKRYCHTSKSKVNNKRYTFFRANKCNS